MTSYVANSDSCLNASRLSTKLRRCIGSADLFLTVENVHRFLQSRVIQWQSSLSPTQCSPVLSVQPRPARPVRYSPIRQVQPIESSFPVLSNPSIPHRPEQPVQCVQPSPFPVCPVQTNPFKSSPDRSVQIKPFWSCVQSSPALPGSCIQVPVLS